MIETLTTAREELAERGFCSLDGIVPERGLREVERTLRDLVVEAARRLPSEQRERFEAKQLSDEAMLHEGLILLYEMSPRLEQFVVDAIAHSRSLVRLASDDSVNAALAELLAVPKHQLGLTDLNVRVDLPSRFSEHTEKISLPYHQESAYYVDNVSAETGLVLWIPLFDCAREDGAIEVLVGSHRDGRLEHRDEYLLPELKRHRRRTAPDPATASYASEFLDVKRGDLALQHFHLLHRSGKNERRDRVRYTLLARTSHLLAPDYLPVSWR